MASLKNPKLVLSLFITTLIIQGSHRFYPRQYRTLYVRELAGNVSNTAFISGMIASVPRRCGINQRPKLGVKLGDRLAGEDPDRRAGSFPVLLLIPMSFCPYARPGVLALYWVRPALCSRRYKRCWFANSTNQTAGRTFSHNQSFRDIGNATGPQWGQRHPPTTVSWPFSVTAGVVLFNAPYFVE